MPAPVPQIGTLYGLISAVTLNGTSTIGAFVAPTGSQVQTAAAMESQVSCLFLDGGTAPTLPIVCSAYAILGGTGTTPSTANQTTVGTGGASGTGSFLVASGTGLISGKQLIGLQQQSGSFLGEIVSVTSVSGTTVNFSGTLINTYTSGAYLYLLDQTPVQPVLPESATGTLANSAVNSARLFLPTGRWFVAMNNTDTNAVTAYATLDLQITSFA